jgi:Na+/H+ antiporter NhaD/arsenite permease-like protein
MSELEAIAHKAIEATGGSLIQTSMLILWLSAVASAFLDNIPFTATIIPLIQTIGQLGGIDNLNPVWWSLSLGACLGGNGTLIGASANVIVAGIAEKNGSPLSFMGYFKIAFPLMILSIVISSGYIYLRYFAF